MQINTYDEYGMPGSGNTSRFGYNLWSLPVLGADAPAGAAGQMWIAEIGLYHYRNRVYNPAIGRFMQTDPIGQAGGINLYAYVGNDPINYTDPWGLKGEPVTECDINPDTCDRITVTAPRIIPLFYGGGGADGGGAGGGGTGRGQDRACPHVIISPGEVPTDQGFPSREAAVQAIAPAVRAATASTGREYGGRIFQRVGRFYFGPTVEGTAARVRLPSFGRAIEYASWAASWHSHPTDAGSGSRFSGDDLQTFYEEGAMRDRYAPGADPAVEFVISPGRIGRLPWSRNLRYARTSMFGDTVAEACQ